MKVRNLIISNLLKLYKLFFNYTLKYTIISIATETPRNFSFLPRGCKKKKNE